MHENVNSSQIVVSATRFTYSEFLYNSLYGIQITKITFCDIPTFSCIADKDLRYPYENIIYDIHRRHHENKQLRK